MVPAFGPVLLPGRGYNPPDVRTKRRRVIAGSHARPATHGAARAAAVVFAGIAVALNIGKLPPALPVLQRDLGLTLVQVSWMVSLFMIGPALIGIFAGSFVDRFDARRTMIAGLLLSAATGAMGAFALSAPLLFVSRALESVGFLMAVLSGPPLIARFVALTRVRGWLGTWGAYMPTGIGAALFATPALMALVGWRGVWLVCAAAAAIAAALIAFIQATPAPDAVHRTQRGASSPPVDTVLVGRLVRETLRSPRAWLLSICFLFYAGQFIGIFSFLPSIYQDAGLSAQWGATLTAIAVLINMTGNLAAGFLLQHGIARATLIAAAGLTMAICEWLAFGSELAFAWRYGAIMLLSAVGGLIPGTLFATAPFYAPSPAAVSTTIGAMQQGSSLGQFAFPLAIAALAQGTGGWGATWIVTGTAALATVAIAWAMGRCDRTRSRRRTGSSASERGSPG